MDTTSFRLRNVIKNIQFNKMILPLLIFVVIGSVFIKFVWDKSVQTREQDAIQLAETFEEGLHKSFILKLNADTSDLNKDEYKEIKNSLGRLVKNNKEIRFAYILAKKGDKVYILADSESEDSEDYSPPGQEYTEVSKEIIPLFINGQTVIINPVKDRWGTWVSVLVPMKSMDTGEILAVFGTDYPVEGWLHTAIIRTIQVSLIILCLLIILIMLNIAYFQCLQISEERKKMMILDDKLQKSEKLFKAIFDQASVGIAIGHNNRFNIATENGMTNINPMFESITGRTAEELKNIKWTEITHPDDLSADMELFARFKLGEIDGYELEKRYIKPDNTEVWVNKKISSLTINNLHEYNHLCIIEDISMRKEAEKEIQYMIDHDYLTGLFNRKYFEEFMTDVDEKKCAPVSIIYADLNGVRIINDAFGFSEGDNFIIKASEVLKGCLRSGDLLARVGGDEFALILVNTDNEAAHEIINNIEKASLDYNIKNKTKLFEINFSIGCATKENSNTSIFSAAKIADEDLRNNMLLNRKSSHSHIITSMLATVYEKSQETEEHARRLGEISRRIGEMLNLSNKSLSELELLAMLHDIGKVGIDERVLNKTSNLVDDDWIIMKKHPEIGYRIAKSSSDLEHIAEYILSHHERWDGTGYPRGLKGEDIPLLARIIAIADAYDAMTQDRVYRKALTHEQALNEIIKNAGTQFDPAIAQSFIENINMLPTLLEAKND